MDRFEKLVSAALQKDAVESHPDPNLLAAFAENVLPRNERDVVLQHLSSCPECRQVVYLALPQEGGMQQVALAQRSQFRLLIRWGTAVASIAILAFVFGTRYAGRKAATPAPVQIAAENQPRELDRLQKSDNLPATREGSRVTYQARPPEKHMTAKPEAKLRFDESGQVHVATPAATPAQQALSGQLGQKKEDLADAKSKEKLDQDSELTAVNGVRSINQSVAVSGTAGPILQEKVARDAELKRVPAAQSASSAGYAAVSTSGKVTGLPQWRLSPQGRIERSLDSGKTWTQISVADGAVLKALSVNGANVWAGGEAGVLFRSRDAGAHWIQVKPEFAGQKLNADITRIEFFGLMNGAVTTSSGQTWTTSDGGNTWSRK